MNFKIGLGLLFVASFSLGQNQQGKLTSVSETSDQQGLLKYVCTVETEAGKIQHAVELNTNTLQMTVRLAEGVIIRGTASQTTDTRHLTEDYFLQGGSEPLAQQLDLQLQHGETPAVRFTRHSGAQELICE